MKPESRILVPNAIEAKRIIREMRSLISAMEMDYINTLLPRSTMDSDETDRAISKLDKLKVKYQSLFDMMSQQWSRRISRAAIQASDTQLKTSLKEISEQFVLKPLSIQPGTKLNDVFASVTQQSADLFKTIPERFHGKVQQAVMQSIVDGRGMQDLKPFMQKFATQERNYAQNRAMDQTRKAFNGLSRARMEQAGIKKFKWIHTGGGKEPRKLHQHLSGEVFDFDKPPFIGVMYGQDVYGYPADLPNCRCRMRAVLVD